jgi:transcriptional regulator with XRE-family HTH domain
MEVESAFPSEFPTVLADDTLAPSPYQAALFHFRQGMQALCSLAPGAEPRRRAARDELISMLRDVLKLLHLHFAPESEDIATRPFGDVLRQHRDEAGLTQEQLADYAGVSLSLLRKLEQGSKEPSRSSVLALCSVPDLKLVPQEITTLPAVREASHRLAPNWYISPGFDSVSMLTELSNQLNGGGGAIEQTQVYLDHQSALDWIQLCNTPKYLAFRDSFPHDETATRIREVVGQAGLDVIALGPGDAKTEVRLVQSILEESERPNIRFYLLDASQPLLSRAFRHAMDSFGDQPGVFTCGIQGNFHHLPRYMQLHYTPARSHRRRIYTLLGATIGNLDQEPQFFRHALAGAVGGDLLLFDVEYSQIDSIDPKEVRRKDPAFAATVAEDNQRWLGGPIRRYCREVQNVSFTLGLDTDRPLPGSYGIQFLAKVQLLGGQSKEFCMWQVRRYQPQSIVDCLRGLGWQHVGLMPFRGSKTRPRGVFLFQKQLPKETRS